MIWVKTGMMEKNAVVGTGKIEGAIVETDVYPGN